MPLISGTGGAGDSGQRATAKGKIIRPTSPSRFEQGSRDLSGGGGSGGSSASPGGRFAPQQGTRKLLPYEYFTEPRTVELTPEQVAKTVPNPDVFMEYIEGKRAIEEQLGVPKDSTLDKTGMVKEIPGEKRGNKGRESYKMTWEQYQALSDRQRGAVDFNSMLVSARQQDLKSQDEYAKLDDTTKATYDKAVRRMFGEDGGSETYAPRTMAELRRIGFDGKAHDADLDQFLSLEVAIDQKDLKNFKVDSKESSMVQTGAAAGIVSGMPEDSVFKIQDAVLDGMRDLTEKLQKGNQLLQGFRPSMARDISVRDDLKFMGGIEQKPARMAPGFREGAKPGEEATIDDYFRTVLEKLATKTEDPAVTWGKVNQILRPEEFQLLGNYIDSVTRNAELYDGALKNGNGRYRSAAEVRALSNLDKGE